MAIPLQLNTIATGLEHPWSVAFLPGGRFLVTERPGRMRIIEADGTLGSPLTGLPATLVVSGQGGILDVVLDPDYTVNQRLYFSFAESGPGGSSTAVARAELDVNANALDHVEVIFSQQPKVFSDAHFGGRIVVSADRQHLYINTGDRGLGDQQPQQIDNEIGKVLRIQLDGQVPGNNPFPGGQRIWSIGHRNIQGAAIHPNTGVLWTHEHGPQGGDELNIIQSGKNYGWPNVSYGCQYGMNPCLQIGGGTHAQDYVEPLTHWGVPSTAPSGMAFYTADAIPQWRGKLLVGALAGRTLWLIDIDSPGPIVCADGQRQRCSEVVEVTNFGERIRDVRQGPDGGVYLLTDSPAGLLIRLGP